MRRRRATLKPNPASIELLERKALLTTASLVSTGAICAAAPIDPCFVLNVEGTEGAEEILITRDINWSPPTMEVWSKAAGASSATQLSLGSGMDVKETQISWIKVNGYGGADRLSIGDDTTAVSNGETNHLGRLAEGYADNNIDHTAVIIGGDGADTINGGHGDDQIWTSRSNTTTADTFGAGDVYNEVNAKSGNDAVFGSDQPDSLQGSNGDDGLYSRGGDDTINGNYGSDTIDGGVGNDKLYGHTHNSGGTSDEEDVLYGRGGTDTLHGGEGDDYLDGGDGADSLHGGSHDDYLYGQGGDDSLYGWLGADYLHGGDGDDSLDAGPSGLSVDVLYGHSGNNVLVGLFDLDDIDIYGTQSAWWATDNRT